MCANYMKNLKELKPPFELLNGYKTNCHHYDSKNYVLSITHKTNKKWNLNS